MLAEIPTNEYQATLDRCADDLLWEAGVGRPPVDAEAVATRLGMVVTHDAAMAGRGRLARLATDSPCGGQATIVLADEARPERRQFTLAHEVGEAHAQRVYETLGVDPREATDGHREQVANALAGRLLAPSRWLRGLWSDTEGDLHELKRVFATASYELLVRRVLDCVHEPLVVTVTDRGRVTWRRWNLPGLAPPRLPLEIDAQHFAHETGQPAWGDGRDEPQTLAGSPVQRVRCWPIHEPDWRREITVTELVVGWD